MRGSIAVSLFLVLALAIYLGVTGESDSPESPGLGIKKPMSDGGDFRVRVPANIPSTPLRDLFATAQESRKMVVASFKPVVAMPTPVPRSAPGVTTPPTLAGIVVKRGRAEAYFIVKDERVIARRGDLLTSRYRIERIEPTGVRLRDIKTGQQRTISWEEGEGTP